MNEDSPRPRITINCAISADGKLAPDNRQFTPFTSTYDHHLLFQLRAQADAVMAGARTAESSNVTMGIGGKKYAALRKKNKLRPEHLRILVSGSGSLNSRADIFKDRSLPILLLTTAKAPAIRLKALKSVVDEIAVFGEKTVDWLKALDWLYRKHQVKHLLCEGGGGLNAELFRHGLVNELYLTIAPVLIGGRKAPTLADGTGIHSLEKAIPLLPLKWQIRKGELFARFQVNSGNSVPATRSR
ncbi:MAG: dihydrofolate reductase family protein [Verrucomicrobiota bacterium]|nr:dihydrofolate reductase family protein [Verrucomicrobiota bacterium]